MASTWKYASLPAQERIEMLKNGEKEVFDEEVERTKEVVKARRELGLDTKQQEDWLDTVAYNYNLSTAENMGISKDNVAKTGYADIYLDGGNKTTSSGRTSVTEYKTTTGLTSTPITNAKRKIEKAGELAKQAIEKQYADMKTEIEKQFYEANPYIREAILNRGGHDDGGNMARANLELINRIDEVLAEKDIEKEQKLLAIEKKYANLVEQLLDYRRNGAAKSSLGIIADGMIMNAAREDGFDYTQIPGVSIKKPIKIVKHNNDVEKIDYSDIVGKDIVAQSGISDEKKKLLLMSQKEEDNTDDTVTGKADTSEIEDGEKKLTVTDLEIFKKISDSISEIAENVKNGALEKALGIIMKYGNIGKGKASLILKLIKDSLSM